MNLFSHETWLFALLALPLIAALLWWSETRRKRRLARLIDTPLQASQLRSRGPQSRAVRFLLVVLSLGALVVALARPVGGETTQPFSRSGRDVVFVVDVSRSMLAEDITPNRIERAKQIVRDGLGTLRGDRVAIVAFAGTAVVKCPLTTDTAFARLAVDELAPDSVSRGGSLIGDALRSAVDSLFPEIDDGRVRDIVLITDGEDHGSFPVEAAAALTNQNARLITIGLGLPTSALRSRVVTAECCAMKASRSFRASTRQLSNKWRERRRAASIYRSVTAISSSIKCTLALQKPATPRMKNRARRPGAPNCSSGHWASHSC